MSVHDVRKCSTISHTDNMVFSRNLSFQDDQEFHILQHSVTLPYLCMSAARSIDIQLSWNRPTGDVYLPCKSPIPPTVTAFQVMYSSRPRLLPSRPNPLKPTPPNGLAASLISPVLTPTMPTSKASAIL